MTVTPPISNSPEGMPAWVKVFAVVGVIVAVVFVASHLAGGGPRHRHAATATDPAP